MTTSKSHLTSLELQSPTLYMATVIPAESNKDGQVSLYKKCFLTHKANCNLTQKWKKIIVMQVFSLNENLKAL